MQNKSLRDKIFEWGADNGYHFVDSELNDLANRIGLPTSAGQDIAAADVLKNYPGAVTYDMESPEREFLEWAFKQACVEDEALEPADVQVKLEELGLLEPVPLEPGETEEDEQYRLKTTRTGA